MLANDISAIVSYGNLFSRSRAANSAICGLFGLKFELVLAFMVVLITCKNKEDWIKSEGARVLTSLNIYLSDAQGQLTP